MRQKLSHFIQPDSFSLPYQFTDDTAGEENLQQRKLVTIFYSVR